MGSPQIKQVATAVRRNVWWVVPPLTLAVGLGIALGQLILPLFYTVANLAGVWLYCDHHGREKLGRQRWVKLLAIPLLPTGLLGVLASGDGLSPSEKAGAGSDDPNVRRASAVASASSPAANMPSSL